MVEAETGASARRKRRWKALAHTAGLLGADKKSQSERSKDRETVNENDGVVRVVDGEVKKIPGPETVKLDKAELNSIFQAMDQGGNDGKRSKKIFRPPEDGSLPEMDRAALESSGGSSSTHDLENADNVTLEPKKSLTRLDHVRFRNLRKKGGKHVDEEGNVYTDSEEDLNDDSITKNKDPLASDSDHHHPELLQTLGDFAAERELSSLVEERISHEERKQAGLPLDSRGLVMEAKIEDIKFGEEDDQPLDEATERKLQLDGALEKALELEDRLNDGRERNKEDTGGGVENS